MSFKKCASAVSMAIGLSCGLAGCAATPGDLEVREAIKGRLDSMGLGPSGGKETKEFDESLAKVKVVGCKKAKEKDGFNCDWTGAEQFAPVVPNSGRIVKSDKGWMLASAGG